MADRLLRLRHEAVIGRHHEHGAVGHIGPTGPHLREGFVAGSIDERNRAAVPLNRVGPHVLGDAAALTRRHIHTENAIEQRRLAVIDMAQKRHDRRPRHAERRILVHGVEAGEEFLFQILGRFEVELHAQFRCQQFDHVAIEHRAHAGHRFHAERQQLLEHFAGGQTDGLREGPDGAGHLDRCVGLSRSGSRHRGAPPLPRTTATTQAIFFVTNAP